MSLILSGPHPLTFTSIGIHFPQAELAIIYQWIIELRRQVLFDEESKNAPNFLNIRFQHVSWLIYMLIISPWHLLFCQRNLLMNTVWLTVKIWPSHHLTGRSYLVGIICWAEREKPVIAPVHVIRRMSWMSSDLEDGSSFPTSLFWPRGFCRVLWDVFLLFVWFCLFFGRLFWVCLLFKGLRMVAMTSQEEHHAKLPLRWLSIQTWQVVTVMVQLNSISFVEKSVTSKPLQELYIHLLYARQQRYPPQFGSFCSFCLFSSITTWLLTSQKCSLPPGHLRSGSAK